jgi:hypothetical protein
MQGRVFIDVARRNLSGGTESFWRAAAGRAYYAIMLEARDVLARWGLQPPPRNNIHYFVQSRFNVGPDPGVLTIGATLNRLKGLRTGADYDLSALPKFRTDVAAIDAVQKAEEAIQLLDVLIADLPRQKSVAADMRKAYGP